METTSSAPKILLVICPSWGIESPPLGLACISEYLAYKGIHVELLDLNIDIYNRVSNEQKNIWNRERANAWWVRSLFDSQIKPCMEKEIEWAASQIIDRDIDVIGFSVYATNRLFTLEVVKKIKRIAPHKKIIIGGKGIYDALERMHFPEGLVDFFIIGEGEETLYQLLSGNIDFPCLAKKNSDHIPPYFMDSLDGFPLVIYKYFDLNKYTKRLISLLLSRGCIFRCAFCNSWRNAGKLRSRKAEDVFEEIKHLYHSHNIKEFYFNDQAINCNIGELNKLCLLLIKAPFDIEWTALAIPIKTLTLELLVKMKEAGCKRIVYGIESGSNAVLKLMNKNFTPEESSAVLKNTKQADIENIMVNFLIGFPGETEDDFNQTLKFVVDNKDYISDIGGLNMCSPILGSDLYLNRERYNIMLPSSPEAFDMHWYTSDNKNTFSSRVKRYNRLVSLLKSLNYCIAVTNINYGDDTNK